LLKLTHVHRRALELLAGSAAGCTEALMLAHGFTVETLCALVGAGLATVKAARMMVAGGNPVEMTRVYITHAGRVALERR
jgi:hypothetical protein